MQQLQRPTGTEKPAGADSEWAKYLERLREREMQTVKRPNPPKPLEAKRADQKSWDELKESIRQLSQQIMAETVATNSILDQFRNFGNSMSQAALNAIVPANESQWGKFKRCAYAALRNG